MYGIYFSWKLLIRSQPTAVAQHILIRSQPTAVAQHNEYRVLVVHELWVRMYGVGAVNAVHVTCMLHTLYMHT